MRRRLLFLITKAEIGGAQSHVADLVRGFAAPNEKRYEVHLAAGSEGPLLETARRAGAQVHLLPRLVRSINPFSDFAAVRECAALVRRLKPDLIHAHSSKAGIVGRLAGRLTRTPTVFTAHGWGFSPGVPPRRRALALQIERLMAPLAQKIICVSEFDRQLALKYRVGNSHSLVTVRGGIRDENFAEQAAKVAGPTPRFIMVARFSEQKDQPTLLRALQGVEELHLDLVGSGPNLAACQLLAQSLGIAHRVTFWNDRDDVADFLSRADAFVLATHYEGLPISILEAMRAALPVIATDVGGNSEEIEHNFSGILVPHDDIEALSRALEQLARSPELRKKLGQAGREKFLSEFTVERMIRGVEAVYDDLLDAHFPIQSSQRAG